MSQGLEKTFHLFAISGKTNATGKEMTSKDFSKLCKECNILESGCTSTDVDIIFAKVKAKGAHVITFEEFMKALDLLAVKRYPAISAIEAIAAIHKLVEGKEPAAVGTTKAVTGGAVDRLTDTSKYTGSHKERFDAGGKGKGLAGREDQVDNSGYVGAYKGTGTYDQKTKK
ncbi:hypothetical protein GDO78_007189 [Eleutherodactylus coqui]|uniref:Tubulin polymerization-promoting protein family member 3 n=1 Tax=Eleutherodactylus coqui TaxID=57060 RepID=A0A8J6KFM3_ELECQ|nr:hypothetical protein GDO78_007189 [Eleutherodactylus coqui]